MKIKALISFAALDFSLAAGNIKEVPDEIATSLINSNYAEEVVEVKQSEPNQTQVTDVQKPAGEEEKVDTTDIQDSTGEEVKTETTKAKKPQKAVKANENQ